MQIFKTKRIEIDANDKHSLKTEVNKVISHLNEEKKEMIIEGGWIFS